MFARLVALDGSVGGEIAVSSGLADHVINNVAFGGGSFLVVWVDDLEDTEVLGRFIGLDGTPGAEFSINASPPISDGPASVLFAGGQFLVAFSDLVVEVPEDEDRTQMAIDDFFRCIREGTQPYCGIEFGKTALLTTLLGRKAFFEERVVTWEDLLREDAPTRRVGDRPIT